MGVRLIGDYSFTLDCIKDGEEVFQALTKLSRIEQQLYGKTYLNKLSQQFSELKVLHQNEVCYYFRCIGCMRVGGTGTGEGCRSTCRNKTW